MSDGITHINIYSKATTELGRMLSNFANSPIQTVDGQFASIEGYWYWIGCSEHPEADKLRRASGYKAKELGRELGAEDWSFSPKFKFRIYHAMLTKLLTMPDLFELFYNNKLPFRHYYMYGNKIVEPKEGQWIVDMWTFLQKQL